MAASGLTRHGDNEAGARKRQIYFPFVSVSSNTRAGTSLSASAASGHRTGTAGAQRGEAALRSYKKLTQEASQTRARPRAQRPRTGRGATACGAVREEKKPNTPGISLRYSRRLAGQGPFSTPLRPSSRCLRLSPRHGKDPNPPLSPGRRGHGMTPRCPVGSRTPQSAARLPAVSAPHAPGPAATAFPRSGPARPISGRGGRARTQLTGRASQSQRGKRARHASAL